MSGNHRSEARLICLRIGDRRREEDLKEEQREVVKRRTTSLPLPTSLSTYLVPFLRGTARNSLLSTAYHFFQTKTILSIQFIDKMNGNLWSRLIEIFFFLPNSLQEEIYLDSLSWKAANGMIDSIGGGKK